MLTQKKSCYQGNLKTYLRIFFKNVQRPVRPRTSGYWLSDLANLELGLQGPRFFMFSALKEIYCGRPSTCPVPKEGHWSIFSSHSLPVTWVPGIFTLHFSVLGGRSCSSNCSVLEGFDMITLSPVFFWFGLHSRLSPPY